VILVYEIKIVDFALKKIIQQKPVPVYLCIVTTLRDTLIPSFSTAQSIQITNSDVTRLIMIMI